MRGCSSKPLNALWCEELACLRNAVSMQYSDGNPLNAICGRGDLSLNKPRAYGCYDTKVASFRMAQQLLAEGIVGPAGQESGLEPFSWSGAVHSLQNVSHVGEADKFAFTFELLQPSSLVEDRRLGAIPVS